MSGYDPWDTNMESYQVALYDIYSIMKSSNSFRYDGYRKITIHTLYKYTNIFQHP